MAVGGRCSKKSLRIYGTPEEGDSAAGGPLGPPAAYLLRVYSSDLIMPLPITLAVIRYLKCMQSVSDSRAYRN